MNDSKAYTLPPISPKAPQKFEEEEDYIYEELPDMDDRLHKASGLNYPNFIRDDLEIKYFDQSYNRIKENGTIILSTDFDSLGMLAYNLSLVDKCNFAIARQGMNILVPGDRKRIMKRNPALDVLKDAQAAVRFWSKEFKMTPNSRGNQGGLGGIKSGTVDNFDDI